MKAKNCSSVGKTDCVGSAKVNWREPKSWLGRVFNSMLSRFAELHNECMSTPKVENSVQVWSC